MNKILLITGLGLIFVLAYILGQHYNIQFKNSGQLFGLGALVLGYFGGKLSKLAFKTNKLEG